MIVLKILQVVPYFAPAYAFGGPVKVVHQISKELVRRGHEVVVYTSDARDPISRLDIESDKMVDGITVHYFKNLSMIWGRMLKLFITLKLIPYAKREMESYDVVHLHEYTTFQNIVVSHYAEKYGVPCILQAHGSIPRIMTMQKLRWLYDGLFGYRLLKSVSKVVALSRSEAMQYLSVGVPKNRIVVIPNGVDLSEYTDLPPRGSFRAKLGIPKKSKVILYLGRIHKTKRLDFLVRAYAYLTGNIGYDDAVLVIAGPDDGYLSRIESLAKSVRVSGSMLITGFLSSKDRLAALVDADVFVTPSFFGFPMTFLEACAAGTPIVTTSLGDSLEWIDHNAGYVTRPRYRDFAKAIWETVSNSTLRERLSRNCRRIVKAEFSLAKVVTRLERTYSEVARSGAASG